MSPTKAIVILNIILAKIKKLGCSNNRVKRFDIVCLILGFYVKKNRSFSSRKNLPILACVPPRAHCLI